MYPFCLLSKSNFKIRWTCKLKIINPKIDLDIYDSLRCSTMDYIEVYITPKNTTNASFEKNMFDSILKQFKKNVSTKKYTCFQKQVIKSFYQNLVLEETYDDIVSQKIPIKENVCNLITKSLVNSLYEPLSDTGIVNYYKKEIKPMHNFPSTTEIYEKIFEDKVVFKINNRLFMNFTTTTYRSDSKEKYYYIYMNYNNSDKCDIKMNVNAMITIGSLINNE